VGERNQNRYNINSLNRALKIMELLAEEGKALGVTELSRRLDLDKSMTHRLLSTLAGGGYVEQDPESKKYLLGLKIVELAGMKLNSIELLSAAKPYLKELVRQTAESSHLAVMVDHEVVYLDKEEGPSVLTIRGGVGLKCPAHCSAVGKVLLADLSEEDLMQILRRHGLTKYTENTILSVAALKEHLAQVRQRGYGVDNEETYLGVKCVAAPIRNHSGRVTASAGISGPIQRMTEERLRVLAEIVVETCARVSARLGAAAPVLATA